MEKENPLYSTDTSLLDKYFKSPKGERRLRYNEMLARFQKENMLSDGELFLRSRERRIVKLRQEFFYKVINELGYSFSELGRMFKMDHTTIQHGYKAYEASHGLGRQDSKRETENTR